MRSFTYLLLSFLAATLNVACGRKDPLADVHKTNAVDGRLDPPAPRQRQTHPFFAQQQKKVAPKASPAPAPAPKSEHPVGLFGHQSKPQHVVITWGSEGETWGHQGSKPRVVHEGWTCEKPILNRQGK